uniref:Uncharacterized protein n=1 Tax=Cacopsylla melanoneura TaxID=428564 RepID=A0A8D8VQ07_9HEMI
MVDSGPPSGAQGVHERTVAGTKAGGSDGMVRGPAADDDAVVETDARARTDRQVSRHSVREGETVLGESDNARQETRETECDHETDAPGEGEHVEATPLQQS